jgi:hypothetical protein
LPVWLHHKNFKKTNPGPTNYQLGAAFFFFLANFHNLANFFSENEKNEKKKGFFGGFLLAISRINK